MHNALTKNETIEIINNNSKSDRAISIQSYKYQCIPFYNETISSYEVASVCSSHQTEDSKINTSSIVCLGTDKYFLECGNDFLTGTLTNKADLIEEALKRVVPENQDELRRQMEESWNSYATNTGCTNNRLQSNLQKLINSGDVANQPGEVVCKHIKNMFADMPTDVADELEKMRKSYLKKMRKTFDNSILGTLEQYSFQGESILVVGPGGDGKTFTVKDFAIGQGFKFVELQAHPSMEAIDMFGFEKKTGDNFVWLDGKVTQAARMASQGHETVLFIDEFTNLPMGEAAGLKASFEPYKGHYYFQTGRIVDIEDGIGVIETIKVPVDKLQIICAANIGDGYASEEIDKALKQRFIVLYYEATRRTVEKVLTSICNEKGFNTSLVQNLLNFQEEMRAEVLRGDLPEQPRLRHLSRKLLGLMKSEDELEDVALMQINQFVEFDCDGKPVQEQVEAVEILIEKHLAA